MLKWLPSKEERARNALVEAELKRASLELSREIKMLLLGGGNCGKTTLRKQMRLKYGKPWSKQEREEFREIVWTNILDGAKVLCEGFDKIGIQPSPKIVPLIQRLLGHEIRETYEDAGISNGMRDALKTIWADPSTRELVSNANELQLNDTVAFFFNSLDRISPKTFLPTDNDILHVRIRKTGIIEERFNLPTQQKVLRVCDVGGQRSERKKWIHCCKFSTLVHWFLKIEDRGVFQICFSGHPVDGVAVLMFVIAINEYDQSLFEDENVNAFNEALMIFSSILQSQWFLQSTCLLIMNKLDLFEQKIKTSPLENYFPDYEDTSLEGAKLFVQRTILMRNPVKTRRIYSHFATATNTVQAQFVIQAVMDTIAQTFLSSIL